MIRCSKKVFWSPHSAFVYSSPSRNPLVIGMALLTVTLHLTNIHNSILTAKSVQTISLRSFRVTDSPTHPTKSPLTDSTTQIHHLFRKSISPSPPRYPLLVWTFLWRFRFSMRNGWILHLLELPFFDLFLGGSFWGKNMNHLSAHAGMKFLQ